MGYGPQVTIIGDALSRRVLTIINCLTLKLLYKYIYTISVWCSYTYNHGGGGVSHSITECAEHIHIIITSAKKADNVTSTLEPVTYHNGSEELKLAGNIRI